MFSKLVEEAMNVKDVLETPVEKMNEYMKVLPEWFLWMF